MKNAEKIRKEIEDNDVSVIVHSEAEYKPKKKVENKFADLW